jgi:hypothetical protein
MAASVARADALRRAGRPEAVQAVALADHFCTTQRRQVKALFRALWRNDDAATYRTGRAVLAGEHAWLEKGGIGLDVTVEALTPKLPPVAVPPTAEKERPAIAARPAPVA